MNSGDTFLFMDGRDDHLWMVISDTAQNPDRFVIVRFLSWQEKYDQACVLDGGEHPFIKHATCVDYPTARIVTNKVMDALQVNNHLKLRIPLSSELLTLIRQKSIGGDISTECIAMLGEQGLVDYP
jgi:hypothetical protein